MRLFLLHFKQMPIYEQLQLEEALLRADCRNFCILNEGSSPAIVMGISGDATQLVDQKKMDEKPVDLIRRFSGGGTVIVDEDTLFVSFICQKNLLSFPAYPEHLLRWGEEIYKNALNIPNFQLRENDYAIGEKKCAGNAQYLRKERYLQHTTFLWDYKQEKMDYLLHPPKTPRYREGRSHQDFVCKLKDQIEKKESFFDQLKLELGRRFELVPLSLSDVISVLELPHRKSTSLENKNSFTS